jgi:tripartite-type tricarboxylate transporter receptor subunit TctC
MKRHSVLYSTFREMTIGMGLVMVIATSAVAQQDYPNRPIRMIVAGLQGGTPDLLARTIGARLTEIFKQPIIVDNRPSALGVIAAELTASAAPDGYTLLLCYHQHTVNAALNSKLAYHPVNSFTPITQLTSAGLILVVNSSTPVKNLKDFLVWTKNNQGPLNFGSAGNGSGGHLAGELYKTMTGVKAQHIPYKGTGPAITDLLASRYDFIFTSLQGAAPNLVRAGKLRALAVTAPRRLAAWPDLPAMAEVLPGFEVVGWYGLIGPDKLPKPIVARLQEEVRKALSQPELRERIVADGAEPVGSTPEEFREFMLADLAKWGKLVKESGAKLD